MTVTVIDADLVFFCVTRNHVDELWGLLAEATRQYDRIDEDTPLVRVIVEGRQMLADFPYRGTDVWERRSEMLARLQAACPHPLFYEDGYCYCCQVPLADVEMRGGQDA